MFHSFNQVYLTERGKTFYENREDIQLLMYLIITTSTSIITPTSLSSLRLISLSLVDRYSLTGSVEANFKP